VFDPCVQTFFIKPTDELEIMEVINNINGAKASGPFNNPKNFLFNLI
jgi:hypothetical protein